MRMRKSYFKRGFETLVTLTICATGFEVGYRLTDAHAL